MAPDFPDADGAVMPPPSSALGSLLRFVLAACGLALLAVVVATPLDPATQAILGGAVFAGSLLLGRAPARTVTVLLVVLSLAVSARYMTWRITSTVETGWSVDA